jgi:hypothetical protein
MNQDWEIRKRSESCTATQHPFQADELFYTALYREADNFRRDDVCAAAWAARPAEPAPFSFWKTKFEVPPPPPPEPLGKQDAEGLLRKLIKENSDATKNARYILALMLERKRILKPMESSDPDIMVYERAGTGETFLIPNPASAWPKSPKSRRR